MHTPRTFKEALRYRGAEQVDPTGPAEVQVDGGLVALLALWAQHATGGLQVRLSLQAEHWRKNERQVGALQRRCAGQHVKRQRAGFGGQDMERDQQFQFLKGL